MKTQMVNLKLGHLYRCKNKIIKITHVKTKYDNTPQYIYEAICGGDELDLRFCLFDFGSGFHLELTELTDIDKVKYL